MGLKLKFIVDLGLNLKLWIFFKPIKNSRQIWTRLKVMGFFGKGKVQNKIEIARKIESFLRN